jgi:hypothetical protein
MIFLSSAVNSHNFPYNLISLHFLVSVIPCYAFSSFRSALGCHIASFLDFFCRPLTMLPLVFRHFNIISVLQFISSSSSVDRVRSLSSMVFHFMLSVSFQYFSVLCYRLISDLVSGGVFVHLLLPRLIFVSFPVLSRFVFSVRFLSGQGCLHFNYVLLSLYVLSCLLSLCYLLLPFVCSVFISFFVFLCSVHGLVGGAVLFPCSVLFSNTYLHLLSVLLLQQPWGTLPNETPRLPRPGLYEELGVTGTAPPVPLITAEAACASIRHKNWPVALDNTRTKKGSPKDSSHWQFARHKTGFGGVGERLYLGTEITTFHAFTNYKQRIHKTKYRCRKKWLDLENHGLREFVVHGFPLSWTPLSLLHPVFSLIFYPWFALNLHICI